LQNVSTADGAAINTSHEIIPGTQAELTFEDQRRAPKSQATKQRKMVLQPQPDQQSEEP